jgi:hypothetical protein
LLVPDLLWEKSISGWWLISPTNTLSWVAPTGQRPTSLASRNKWASTPAASAAKCPAAFSAACPPRPSGRPPQAGIIAVLWQNNHMGGEKGKKAKFSFGPRQPNPTPQPIRRGLSLGSHYNLEVLISMGVICKSHRGRMYPMY